MDITLQTSSTGVCPLSDTHNGIVRYKDRVPAPCATKLLAALYDSSIWLHSLDSNSDSHSSCQDMSCRDSSGCLPAEVLAEQQVMKICMATE